MRSVRGTRGARLAGAHRSRGPACPRGGHPAALLVAPRLADLAAALVDVPLALARGRPTPGREVALHVLTRSTRAAVRAFAADYTR
jgi:hypothetical protein